MRFVWFACQWPNGPLLGPNGPPTRPCWRAGLPTGRWQPCWERGPSTGPCWSTRTPSRGPYWSASCIEMHIRLLTTIISIQAALPPKCINLRIGFTCGRLPYIDLHNVLTRMWGCDRQMASSWNLLAGDTAYMKSLRGLGAMTILASVAVQPFSSRSSHMTNNENNTSRTMKTTLLVLHEFQPLIMINTIYATRLCTS